MHIESPVGGSSLCGTDFVMSDITSHKVNIRLPDSSIRTYDGPVTGHSIAADIGAGLARAALAAKVDGKIVDLQLPIEKDASVSIVTLKDPDVLELLRHDAAHALAEAAKELFPNIQVTIGPAIDDGFYYDFSREDPFTPDDLESMETRMREIVDRDEVISREVWEKDQAIQYFESVGEYYKAKIVADLPNNEPITIYRQGEFTDLCRGPHLPSTGRLGKAFKLLKVSGAYWRGDSRNEMLQRVYGTAWRDKKELDGYLHRIAEAERRDHRRLGREMGLFHQQEEAAGMVFWHPNGWQLYRTIEAFVRTRLEEGGYIEVKTPQLIDRSLWEASGHWDKFRENMYSMESEEKTFALKPMNCPGHVQVFRQELKSYRDLPLRMAEFGSCHRYEPSGALHGLMRVRNFNQDDAHIFCTEDQINVETEKFVRLLLRIYSDFGFDDVKAKFSDRPQVRAGTDEIWDRAEKALKGAIESIGLDCELNPGDGAFYGPKLDFVLTDAIGRQWQCGTLQVDFVLPERLNANYIGQDGDKHRPVMLHRTVLGSFERFIGILIEQYAGHFPLWLGPVQAVVATITKEGDQYAEIVADQLSNAGLRVRTDLRNEKIGYKVREHSLAKIPIILAIGKKEAENGTVSLRRLGYKEQESLVLADAVTRLRAEASIPV